MREADPSSFKTKQTMVGPLRDDETMAGQLRDDETMVGRLGRLRDDVHL